MMEREIRISADGSHTLYSPQHGDTFHSVHGAISESRHIFIGLGLGSSADTGDSLRILELGWGTGLNTLLTIEALKGTGTSLFYHGVEAYPLPVELIKHLNYDLMTGLDLLESIHQLPWSKPELVEENVTLFKEEADIRSFQPWQEAYDLIYFDAFAPDLQPELWTEEVFRRIWECSAYGAVLVTYSSKGSVRRALQAAGFRIEKHPGPAGKREVVKAIKE
jgi:tRNA U34 5-methylaminomethyl-2-thiouridine-forming methyltransferase MnmC